GERGEHRSGGRDQPDLIAVPDRSDGVQQHALAALLAGQERQEHAHTEVESVEEQVSRPQHDDEDEPDRGENFHRDSPQQANDSTSWLSSVIVRLVVEEASSGIAEATPLLT